jgi:preprotein translocase subunit SecE
MNKLIQFLKEVRLELSRVNWPTRQQTARHTATVVVISIAVAIFLGAWDAIFGFILNKLLFR